MASSSSSPPRRTAPSPLAPPGTSPRSSITKGATARSAVSSPRTASSANGTAAKRQSSKAIVAGSAAATSETREVLVASLKRETDEKELLLVQVQDKEQTIATLTSENVNLTSALNAAESRLGELYADQGRMEDELATRLELVDKLRAQLRDFEKERRDIQRRYTEQTTSFDAERQSFYDNEQHLKSRIQSLTQARKQAVPSSPVRAAPPSPINTTELEAVIDEVGAGKDLAKGHSGEAVSQRSEPTTQDMDDEESEPAEMTALKLELSTLATSHSSLETTLKVLQTQLADLTRVNQQLQEENESYNILLTEKTLSGQFDILQQAATAGSDDGDDGRSLRSSARSTLDPVDEEDDEQVLDLASELSQADSRDEDEDERDSPGPMGRPSRRKPRSRGSPALRGESLADLPITGPGLDLAAELGRAENKDILEGHLPDERERSVVNKGRKKKSSTESAGGRKFHDTLEVPASLEALRSEVKSLKDANKALSLYASKIIDRIISQEGFEHVLSVDFDKLPPTPGPQSAAKTTFSSIPTPGSPRKERPQSAFFGRFGPRAESTPPQTEEPTPTAPQPPLLSSPPAGSASKHQRRSMSFDWKSFSVFGGEKKLENPNLRPLTLRTGGNTVVATRRLDNREDEEDRRERERLNAEMRLMGIDQPPRTAVPILSSNRAESTTPSQDSEPSSPRDTNSSGWRGLWRGSRPPASDGGSIHSASSLPNPTSLTHEALEEAEAQNSLAALDAREKTLSQQIGSGGRSGLTDIPKRRALGEDRSSRRSRRSAGSGSTVWSAGMSKDDGED